MTIHFSDSRVRFIVRRLLHAALAAADPVQALRRSVLVKKHSLVVNGRIYDLRRYRRVVCVGAGKASGQMAVALEKILGTTVDRGLVVVKDAGDVKTRKIEIREAGHPLPDSRGLRAARDILKLASMLDARDLLVVLISGGASSLLPAPVAGVTLAQKKRTTDLLLRCGAPIQDINAVRKHLSLLKGGQLAAATNATIATLILSDVLGDDLGTIGSGPTAPDPTTFHDVRRIVETYHIWRQLPPSVRRHLQLGIAERVAETPKPRSRVFKSVQNVIIGNNRCMLDRVAQAAKVLGFHPLVLTSIGQGEAREIGKFLGTVAREIAASGRPVKPPACVLFGGEPTVTVSGKGKGGRAQELILAAALVIQDEPYVCIVGFGSDGTDGPTDVAGAVVDGKTIRRAKTLGLDARQFLADNNSYGFFQNVGGHIRTGSTGTNVNDVYMVLVR